MIAGLQTAPTDVGVTATVMESARMRFSSLTENIFGASCGVDFKSRVTECFSKFTTLNVALVLSFMPGFTLNMTVNSRIIIGGLANMLANFVLSVVQVSSCENVYSGVFLSRGILRSSRFVVLLV